MWNVTYVCDICLLHSVQASDGQEGAISLVNSWPSLFCSFLKPATKYLAVLMVKTQIHQIQLKTLRSFKHVKFQTFAETKASVERCKYPSVFGLIWVDCRGLLRPRAPEQCVRTFSFAAERAAWPWHSALSAYRNTAEMKQMHHSAIFYFLRTLGMQYMRYSAILDSMHTYVCIAVHCRANYNPGTCHGPYWPRVNIAYLRAFHARASFVPARHLSQKICGRK